MKYLIILFLIITINPAFSHELKKDDRPIEKWYYQITIGTHYEKYKGEINSTIERVKKNTKNHQSHGEASLIGLYLPILDNHKSLFGFKYLDGGWDEYDDEIITIAFFGPSYVHYLDRIGRGIFLYADLGISHLVYEDSKIGEEKTDEEGFAGRIGLGYAIPILKETSFILTLHNTTHRFDIGIVNLLSANIGFLW